MIFIFDRVKSNYGYASEIANRYKIIEYINACHKMVISGQEYDSIALNLDSRFNNDVFWLILEKNPTSYGEFEILANEKIDEIKNAYASETSNFVNKLIEFLNKYGCDEYKPENSNITDEVFSRIKSIDLESMRKPIDGIQNTAKYVLLRDGTLIIYDEKSNYKGWRLKKIGCFDDEKYKKIETKRYFEFKFLRLNGFIRKK